MSRFFKQLPALALLVAVAAPALAVEPADEGYFEEKVKPIFEAHCYKCHGPDKDKGKLQLHTNKLAFKEDYNIIPGDAKESELHIRVSLPPNDTDVMPPEGNPPLLQDEQDIIKAWINAGAKWPDSANEIVHEIPTIDLPDMTDAQKQAEAKGLAAVRDTGALAMKVASNTEAVDVNFALQGDAANDESLKSLNGLEPTLVWLNLARTKVTDAGLAQLKPFKELRRLHLENTGVGDAGLSHLAGLDKLEYLNLYGTSVTDSGLGSVTKLKNLKKLYLWQTAVTEEGVAKLQKAMPNLIVDIGKYPEVKVVDPEPVAEAPAEGGEIINKTCPVSGKPVDAAKFVVFQEQKVGFCCDNCKGNFEKEPDKFISKIENFKPKAEPVAAIINTKCPVSGKDVNEAQFVVYKEKKVAFCCGNCKANFEKEPEKFAGKIAELRE